MNISDTIRQARMRAGISQQKVADLLKIDRPTYNKIEQNKIMPKYEDFPKLCELLQIDLNKLQMPVCAHPKTACAHRVKSKSRVNTYNIHIRANRSDFPLLTRENLKKSNFRHLRDIFAEGYKIFKGCILLANETVLNEKKPTPKELFEIIEQKQNGEISTVETFIGDKHIIYTMPASE